jgi:hypothetical protein
MFSLFNKIREQQGRTGSAQKQEVGAGGSNNQTMYTHVSKCQNNKIKKKYLICLLSDVITLLRRIILVNSPTLT